MYIKLRKVFVHTSLNHPVKAMEACEQDFWNKKMMDSYFDISKPFLQMKIVFKPILGVYSNLLANRESLLVMMYVNIGALQVLNVYSV